MFHKQVYRQFLTLGFLRLKENACVSGPHRYIIHYVNLKHCFLKLRSCCVKKSMFSLCVYAFSPHYFNQIFFGVCHLFENQMQFLSLSIWVSEMWELTRIINKTCNSYKQDVRNSSCHFSCHFTITILSCKNSSKILAKYMDFISKIYGLKFNTNIANVCIIQDIS